MESHLALRRDDGTFVPLPHPVETSALADAGYTWDRARKENRLVQVQSVTCRDCGQPNEKYVPASVLGNKTLLIRAGIFGLLCVGDFLLLPASFSGYLRIGLLFVALAVFLLLCELLSLPRRRALQATLPHPSSCKNCGGQRFYKPNLDTDGPCPKCGKRPFSFQSVAVSERSAREGILSRRSE